MKEQKSIKVAGDLMYTVMASVVMNIALQIIIYPLVTRFFGESATGTILYFIGYIYIIPQALGTAISNTRLVVRKTMDATNADYTPFVVLLSAVSALVCGAIAFFEDSSIWFIGAYGLFSVLYLLRTYAQVEFRLTLRFKEYFFYYCIISVGYLVGLGLYFVTRIWILIFVVGEAAALIYSLVFGSILKKDAPTEARRAITKPMAMIVVSSLMRDCVIQFDKVILKIAINESVVTEYHVVSLIAKTMQMLIQPINTLIMSYLTVKESVLTKKTLAKFTAIAFMVGGVFYGVCIIGTPIYLKLFFPTLYDKVIGYNLIVNLGLILGFLASLFMAVILSQGKTKLHTAIEVVWGIMYVVCAYHFVSQYAILGLAYVTLVMNIIKIIVAVVPLFVLKTKEKEFV